MTQCRAKTHLRFVQELDRDADRAGELAHFDGGVCDTEGKEERFGSKRRAGYPSDGQTKLIVFEEGTVSSGGGWWDNDGVGGSKGEFCGRAPPFRFGRQTRASTTLYFTPLMELR